eukprot:13191972-Ditylum_brightwellii.AAC.1
MHKPLAKKIAHAKKEHDEAGKEKCHGRSELHHKDVTDRGNITLGSIRKNIVTTMGFATMP